MIDLHDVLLALRRSGFETVIAVEGYKGLIGLAG